MRILIIGNFQFDKATTSGQCIKTQTLLKALFQYGKNCVIDYVETDGWIKHPLALVKSIFTKASKNDVLIMLPAQRGVKVFSSLLLMCKRIYEVRVYYDVIGGWLPELLQRKISLSNKLKKFDGIFVESKTMKVGLESMGFRNIHILPNFKNLSILDEQELVFTHHKPYPLCTFSRVMKEKGIEDAVEVISNYNNEAGDTVFSLDIYGAVDSKQKEWFDELEKSFPEYIRYKGIVPANKSVDTVKHYYALLFPTKFFTEGIPGTIIDAYASGVPVIASRWKSFSDVVDEQVTGLGFEFGNREDFSQLLNYIAQHENEVNQFKKSCLLKANEYSAEKSVIRLIHMCEERKNLS